MFEPVTSRTDVHCSAKDVTTQDDKKPNVVDGIEVIIL